jgi:hypothetical protein
MRLATALITRGNVNVRAARSRSGAAAPEDTEL